MPPTDTTHSSLEALAAAMPVPVCLVETDPEDQGRARLRFSNEQAQSRFGGALGAGREVDEIFPPSVVAGRASEVCARAAEDGDPQHLRIRSRGDADPGVPGDVVLVRRLDPSVVALVCDSHGSDWQRAEFHAVVDSALEAILTKSLDGTILSWNAAASRLYGYSEAEAVGMPVTALLPPDRQGEVAQIIARLRKGERINEFETRRVRKDGSTVDVSLTITPVRRPGGEIVGAATIARDVSERRLAESRQRLAAIVDATLYPVFSVGLDGVILTWNAAAERLFGYSAAEMVGAPLSPLLGRVDLASVLVSDAARGGHEEPGPFEVDTHTKGGTDLVVEVGVSPICDDHGVTTAAAVVLRDVTQQRRLEGRLRQKQKLEAIGSLASGIAHDFNNVLSVIRSATGLLSREVVDESSSELVEEIDKAAVHAAELIGQLLAFGRQQILRPEATDLNAQLKETLGMVRSLVSAQVRVEEDLADGLPPIQVDRNQLTQVVMNLCGNAGEAMPDGGSLRLRTTRAGDDVVLEVTDTGGGINAATLEHIFDPFYTTKETGTGLGLATVHGIVEQSGGRIEVDSRLGVGTTFAVCFPVAESLPGGTGERAAAEPPPNRGDEQILVVDDSEALRLVFSRVLESAGYRVITAADGFEAVSVAASGSTPPDLLLSDVVMPGMGGRELYERLRREYPRMGVLFTSGYASDDVLRHGISSGQFDFIPKPATNEELLAQVRATLDRVAG